MDLTLQVGYCKKRYAAVYIAACMLLLTSCTHSKKAVGSTGSLPAQQLSIGNIGDDGNKIVFLTMDMQVTDSAGETYSFKQVDKSIADGTLKGNNANSAIAPEPGYLYCEFLNSSNQATNKLKVEDPLNTVYEYPGDADKSMGKTTITKKTGSVYLKFQYDSNDKYLAIYKFSPVTKSPKKIYYAALVP